MRWCLVMALVAVGCDDAGTEAAADAAPPDMAVTDAAVSDAAAADMAAPDATAPDPCAARRPVVMAHGFLAGGDTFANHFARFVANGYCPDRLYAFDWNTLDRGADHVAALDALIDRALAATGAAQVDLGGHSAGGGLGYQYLADPAGAAKVAHYAHIGSGREDAPTAVPTLNLWSDADLVVMEKGDIPGATNVRLDATDHYAIATTADSFAAIYAFFNDGEAPATTDFPVDAAPVLAGRAAIFGENLPAAGATVRLWALDPETGARLAETPDAEYTVGEDGRWGPFEATAGAHYELLVTPAAGRPVHYYREPFTRSNPLVYLRTLPTGGGLAGTLLSQVPFESGKTVLVNFTANRAIVAGADTLTVDGVELAREDTAAADDTTIATFVYDADRDGVTDATPVALFGAFPFLSGLDVFLPAAPGRAVTVELNGRRLRVPALSAAEDGPVITVFE